MMWKFQMGAIPASKTPHTTMAHRRWVCTGQVLSAVAVVGVLGVLLVGSVVVSNRTTALRGSIRKLENERDMLEVQTARLMVRWNSETSLAAVTVAAAKHLHLRVPSVPDSVLIAVPASGGKASTWSRLRDHLGGAEMVSAAAATPLALRGWRTPSGAEGH